MPLSLQDRAPNFELESLEGGSQSPLEERFYRLLIFYKVSCPTCQLTLPFVEKMFKSYRSAVRFYGISQDSVPDTRSFCANYDLTFPQLIDFPGYNASISYDVQVVPTLYLIDPENNVVFVEEGFVKSSLEELNKHLAEISSQEVNPLFEDVSVPIFKAG